MLTKIEQKTISIRKTEKQKRPKKCSIKFRSLGHIKHNNKNNLKRSTSIAKITAPTNEQHSKLIFNSLGL